MEQAKKRRFKPYDLVFFIALTLLFILSLCKCKYGYGAADEPFYLTLASRLAKGDALFSDEWNLAQLSGLLLLPFYKLHNLINGGTQGIVLHFRYIYVVVQTLVCITLYCNLRKHRFFAVVGVLLFYIFAPYDIMALSYNTMGLMGTALCLVLAYSAVSDSTDLGKRSVVKLLFAGFFFAATVLCNPYQLLLYILALVVLVIAKLFHKADAKHLKLFGIFTLGCAVLAVIVLLFLLIREKPSALVKNLSKILNDPEHGGSSLKTMIYTYVYSMVGHFRVLLISWALLLLIALTDRNKYHNNWMYLGMTELVCAVAMITHIPSIQTDYNLIMFPLVLCGISAYLFTPQKEHKVFFLIYLPGLVYTFCLNLASNQAEHAICMGMPVPLIASVLLIGHLTMQNLAARKENLRFTTPLMIGLTCLILFMQFSVQGYAKSVHAFWEPSVSQLDTRVSVGPLKGVLTTKEHADDYLLLLDEISEYAKGDANSRVLFITNSPWTYLYVDRPIGGYSSWISNHYSGADKEQAQVMLLSRLQEYYLLHPDNIPRQIYIMRNSEWDFSYLSKASNPSSYNLFSLNFFYEIVETDFGYHLTLVTE